MNEWGWAIAAAVLFITLVQLVAYYYLMKGSSNGQMWPSSTDGRGARPSPGVGSADAPFEEGHNDDDVRRCTRCGAPNDPDPIYTYCRNCGAQLS